jgi:DNA-binding Lrp family transcriptional regulator
MDQLEKRILLELDCDASLSFSEIAKRVRRPRDTVENRIQNLLKDGIISRFSPIIDPANLGRCLYKTYLKLRAPTESRQKVVRVLEASEAVFWIALADGAWDLFFSIAAQSLHDFAHEQTRLLKKLSNEIVHYEVFPIIEAHLFRKKYLAKSKQLPPVIIARSPQHHSLDLLDHGILRHLVQDARVSRAKLGQTLGTTGQTVGSRIRKLEDLGVIAGYRIDLDFVKAGILFFKAQLFSSSLRPEREKQLVEFCGAHPHITYFIRQIGSCSIEVEFETETYEEYFRNLDTLRSQFSDIITHVETSLVRGERYRWQFRHEAVERGRSATKIND